MVEEPELDWTLQPMLHERGGKVYFSGQGRRRKRLPDWMKRAIAYPVFALLALAIAAGTTYLLVFDPYDTSPVTYVIAIVLALIVWVSTIAIFESRI